MTITYGGLHLDALDSGKRVELRITNNPALERFTWQEARQLGFMLIGMTQEQWDLEKAPQVRVVHHDPFRIEHVGNEGERPAKVKMIADEIGVSIEQIEQWITELKAKHNPANSHDEWCKCAWCNRPSGIADITDADIKAMNEYGQAAYDARVKAARGPTGASAQRQIHDTHNVSDSFFKCYGCRKELGDEALYEPCPTPDHVGLMSIDTNDTIAYANFLAACDKAGKRNSSERLGITAWITAGRPTGREAPTQGRNYMGTDDGLDRK